MNHDGTQRTKLNHNHINEVPNMNKRLTSLISIITFFAGPIACSDAGDTVADSRGRDSQALTASGGTRDVSTTDDGITDSFTIGATPTVTLTPPTSSPTAAVSTTSSLTIDATAPSDLELGQPNGAATLLPAPTLTVGEIGVDEDIETDGRAITWVSGDGGVRITLGGDADEACSGLKAVCLASGETQQTCDDLVVECEEAIANPSVPTDSIGFVTDCAEMGDSCRAAGIPAEECDKAVAICQSSDAGAAPSPVTIVASCEELRA